MKRIMLLVSAILTVIALIVLRKQRRVIHAGDFDYDGDISFDLLNLKDGRSYTHPFLIKKIQEEIDAWMLKHAMSLPMMSKEDYNNG